MLKKRFLNPVKIGDPPKQLSPVQMIAKYKSKIAEQIKQEKEKQQLTPEKSTVIAAGADVRQEAASTDADVDCLSQILTRADAGEIPPNEVLQMT